MGRWLSVDPYESSYPNISTYSAFGNSPIHLLDEEGGFLIDVHRRITQKAFFQSKKGPTWRMDWKKLEFKISKNIRAYRKAIYGFPDASAHYSGSVVAPDVRSLPRYIGGEGKESNDEDHFDNMDFDGIRNNFNRIYTGISINITLFKNKTIDPIDLGNYVGEQFHAIQDFYSHSNYIELYKEMYGETEFDAIPTFDEVISGSTFSDFASKLESELITGSYPGSGKGSHKDMNHDLGDGSVFYYLEEVKEKKVNWNSKAAEAVAIKATKKVNDVVEQEIDTRKD